MPQHQGVAVVWGIGTTDITVATGKILRINGQTYTRESEMTEHRSTSGEVIGRSRWNFTKSLELEVYPSGTTIANAVDAMIGVPAVGSSVTITEVFGAVTDTGIADTYECMSAVRSTVPTEKASIRMTLLKNAGFTAGSVITA